jgi:hypothetical protein
MKLRSNFSTLKIGDELIRSLGGVRMGVVVGEITDTTFKVGSKDGAIPWEFGWTFNKLTGLEIDEDL